MTIWLTIILAYCVVCWLAAFMALRRHFAVAAGGEDDNHRPRLTEIRLIIILIAPLVMPLVAFVMLLFAFRSSRLLREISTLRRINRSVREYEFIPVDVATVDEPVRERFERLTPPLLELGFAPIGDFQMKPKPVVVHDRILLSSDGETLATVCSVLNEGVVSYMSVLEDGTCVHTTGVKNPHPERTFEPEDRLCLSYRPDMHPINQYRDHRETLRAVGERQGTRPLRLRHDQYRAMMVYDQRLFNRWRYRHGGLDAESPAPDFDTLLAPEGAVREPAGLHG
jgi:hypothetical protein